MGKNIKKGDIVRLTAEAIAENCRLFGRAALFRAERGKNYLVDRVDFDTHNNLQIVYVTDLQGRTIEKFIFGIYGGHLEKI
jgi:hypothetical protein